MFHAFRRYFLPKIRILGGYLFRYASVRVYAFDLRHVTGISTSLQIVRSDDFLTDERLRQAMQESGDWDETELKRRQTLGDVGYFVIDGGRYVHYSWVTRRLRQNTEVGFKATPDDTQPWIYNSYTAPTHRGRLIYPHVI